MHLCSNKKRWPQANAIDCVFIFAHAREKYRIHTPQSVKPSQCTYTLFVSMPTPRAGALLASAHSFGKYSNSVFRFHCALQEIKGLPQHFPSEWRH